MTQRRPQAQALNNTPARRLRDALGKQAVDAIDDELRAMTRDLSALRDGQVVQDVARLLARETTDPAERENWQALLPALAGRHEQVLAAARSAGRIATVFQNRRFDADFLTLQALLAEGTLGDIAECHAHFDRYRPQVRERWREQDGPGSGLWYDLGPHLLDQMLVLFGCPQAIDADLAVQREGGSGVDYFHAVLHYPRHRAIVHAGSLVAAPAPRFAVHGTQASWIKHGLDVQEAQLRRGIAPGAPGWGVDPRHGELLHCDAEDNVQRSTVDNLPGDYRRLYADFAAAMQGEGEPTVSAQQALQVMRLLQAGVDSAREGRRVQVG